MIRNFLLGAFGVAVFACSSPESDSVDVDSTAPPSVDVVDEIDAVDFVAVAAEEAAKTMSLSDFSAETDADWSHPVTAWGDPDLRGTWPINHLTGVPLQRDPAMGERRYLNAEEMQERVDQYAERSEQLGNEVAGSQLGMGHWVEWGTA